MTYSLSELVPPILHRYIKEQARASSSSEEMVFAYMLGILSGAMGSAYSIRPFPKDLWEVIPVLWTLISAPPASLKTPTLDACLSSIVKSDIALFRDYAERLRQWETAVERRKKASKKGEELGELPIKPYYSPRVVNDVTPEKLQEMCAKRPRGMLFVRDEFYSLYKEFSRSGYESFRGLLLAAWSGKSSYTLHRIGRGDILAENVCLTLMGTIQPDVLNTIVKGSLDGVDNDGFLQRFQVMVSVTKMTPRRVDGVVDVAPIEEMGRLIEFLYSDVGELRRKENGGWRYVYRFTSEAQPIFDVWYDELVSRAHASSNAAWSSLLGKYRSLVPSLSLIYQKVLNFSSNMDADVGLEALGYALKTASFLEDHAKNIYDVGISSKLDDEEDAVLQKVSCIGIKFFKIRDVQQRSVYVHRKKATSEKLKVIFQRLVEKGILGVKDGGVYYVSEEGVSKEEEKAKCVELKVDSVKEIISDVKSKLFIKDILQDRLGILFAKDRFEDELIQCPWHEDSTASFAIYDNGSKYKCFNEACCAGQGDVINLQALLDGSTNGMALSVLSNKTRHDDFVPNMALKKVFAPKIDFNEVWNGLDTCLNHKYPTLKKMPCASFKMNSSGDLCIPVRDYLTDEITGIQRITAAGKKLSYKGSKFNGSGFIWGKIEAGCDVLICEGVATGYALRASTGKAVVCAMSGGRILGAHKILKSRYSDCNFILCLDAGEDSQAIIEKAGGNVSYIQAEGERGHDFWDIWNFDGWEAVAEFVDNATLTQAQAKENLLASLSSGGTVEGGLQPYVYIEDEKKLEECLKAYDFSKRTGVDIETTGLDPSKGAKIRLLQLYQDGQPILVIDMFKVSFDSIREFLKSCDKLTAHNALFEMSFFNSLGLLKEMDCTLLKYHSYGGVAIDLGGLCKDLNVFDYASHFDSKKVLQKSDWSGLLTFEQRAYAAMDAYVLVHIWDKIPYKEEVYQRAKEALPGTVKIQARGIRVDRSAHAEFISKTREIHTKAIEDLNKMLPGLFEVSEDGVKRNDKLFREFLSKLPYWPVTDLGAPQTGQEACLQNERYLPPGFAQSFSEYMRAQKILSSYSYACEFVGDRLHPSFKPAGTVTGRYSCENPNLQQIPRGDFRDLFIASEGMELVSFDVSQEELRLVASEANEKKMLIPLENGQDLHQLTFDRIKDVVPTLKVPEGKGRSLGKTLNFGLLYGMQTNLFTEQLRKAGFDVSYEIARDVRNAWLKEYRDIYKWQQKIKAESAAKMYVESSLGRARYFVPYDNADATIKAPTFRPHVPVGYETAYRTVSYFKATDALNFPIQSVGADIMLGLLKDIPFWIEKFGAHVVNIIHDELLIEIPQERVLKTTGLIKERMTEIIKQVYPKIVTTGLIGAGRGLTWGQTKKKENEL